MSKTFNLEAYERKLLIGVDLRAARRIFEEGKRNERIDPPRMAILPADTWKVELTAAGCGLHRAFMEYPSQPMPDTATSHAAHRLCAISRVTWAGLTNNYPMYREVFTSAFIVGYKATLINMKKENREEIEKAIDTMMSLQQAEQVALSIKGIQGLMEEAGITRIHDLLKMRATH